ncbi:hypothetical protein J4470_00490 [Candidatus Woesearchaeota archaeon]|nr:hypothetical protein [Candidatus Woesearchaeota archaeon]
MGKGKAILIGVLVIITAIGAYSYSQSKKPGKFDDFAKCLTANDVKMFGAYWCGACAQQKNLFGKSFNYVNYVECAVRGSDIQSGVCRENEIESYPTWEFADGSRQTGVLPLGSLAERSNCELQQ